MLRKIALGLGSNLGDRQGYLEFAIKALRAQLGDLEVSSYHETAPWKMAAGTPSFINLALVATTRLLPRDLLALLHSIEKQAGRLPHDGASYESRVLDIDYLADETFVLDEPRLTLPHPHLERREFVLLPLQEVWPDFTHPKLGLTIPQMLTKLDTLL